MPSQRTPTRPRRLPPPTTKADDDLTEILVTGIRKALATSQDIKKEADTVVDSITASDIGAFPDKSVAEALQRMSGITVTRFAASGDTTHFSAEPSGVVIRGLPQVRSEFNGRDSFNANSSRGLSFGDVSPELMAGVDTYKNATADMIEGGIAGTVNLRTHVPFNSEGFVAAFSGEVGYGDLAEEAKPSGSLLVSNRWDTGIGEFGLMANAAYSETVQQSQGVQLLRFFNNENIAAFGGGTKWVPGGIDIRENTYTAPARVARWPRNGAAPTSHCSRPCSTTVPSIRTTGRNTRSRPASVTRRPRRISCSPLRHRCPPSAPPPYEFDSNGVFMRGVINQDSNQWVGSDTPALAHPNGYDVGYRSPTCSGIATRGTAPHGLPGDARPRRSEPTRAPRRRPTSPKTCR